MTAGVTLEFPPTVLKKRKFEKGSKDRPWRSLISGGSFSGGGFFRSGGGGSGALLSLLLRQGLFRIIVRLAFGNAQPIEKAGNTIGRLRALGDPGCHLLGIEHDAVGGILRLQRIESAETFDETAIARRVGIGDDDAIEGALFGATARQPDFQGHFSSFLGFKIQLNE